MTILDQLYDDLCHEKTLTEQCILFALCFMFENGYIRTKIMMAILRNKDCHIITKSGIASVFCNEPDSQKRHHFLLSSTLTRVLKRIQKSKDTQKFLQKHRITFERMCFKKLHKLTQATNCSNKTRNLRTLLRSLLKPSEVSAFDSVRFGYAHQQALTTTRYLTLCSTQKVKRMSQKQRVEFVTELKQHNVLSTSQNTDTKNNKRSAKPRSLVTFTSKLTPTKTINHKVTKQYHTINARKPLVDEITAYIQSTNSLFEYAALLTLNSYLVDGNKKNFLHISTIRQYADVLIKIDANQFDVAYYNDNLNEFLEQYIKSISVREQELLLFSLEKMRLLIPQLEIEEITTSGDHVEQIPRAQYVSFIEVERVLLNIIHNDQKADDECVAAQCFTVICSYFFGMRRGEIIRLRFKDIHQSKNAVHVNIKATNEGNTKNNSSRNFIAYVPDSIAILLEQALSILSLLNEFPERAVINYKNSSLYQRIHNVIKPTCLMLKYVIDDDVVLHSLRHSFALNTIMQFRAVYDPQSFYLLPELRNSSCLFSETLLSNLLCDSIQACCINTQLRLGHTHFATTLNTYLAGQAFFFLFTTNNNSADNLFSKNQNTLSLDKLEDTCKDSINFVIETTYSRRRFNVFLANLQNNIEESHYETLHKIPAADLRAIKNIDFNLHKIDKRTLRKLMQFFTVLSQCKIGLACEFRDYKIFSFKGIKGRPLRHLPGILHQLGLWKFMCVIKANERPARYGFKIDSNLNLLIIQFLKQVLNG
jgi:integrase